MEISFKIRKLRKLKKYTQKELAKICSVSSNTIARIERNQQIPKTTTLTKIAKALETDIDTLTSEIDMNVHPAGKKFYSTLTKLNDTNFEKLAEVAEMYLMKQQSEISQSINDIKK